MEEKLKSQSEKMSHDKEKLDRYKRKFQRKMDHMKEEMKEQRIILAEEKNHLLSQIRSQNRDVALLTQVLSSVLSSSEMTKMWTKSQWDEEEERWIVPRLQFNNRWRSGGNHDITQHYVSSRHNSSMNDTKTERPRSAVDQIKRREESHEESEEQERRRRKEKRRRKKKKEMMRRREEEKLEEQKKHENKEEIAVESMF